MYCKITWDRWVATGGAGHPRHAKPAAAGMAHRYNSPLLRAPKQKSLQRSVSTYQFLVGSNNHHLPLRYAVPVPFPVEDGEVRPFGVWPFSCWLMSHTEHITCSRPKGNGSSLGAPAKVELFSWICLSPIHQHKTGSDESSVMLLMGFWITSHHPELYKKTLSDGLQLTEGKNLEGFWVDTFPVLFLPSSDAKLGYISLREQNLRSGKKRFLLAGCCCNNVHSFQKMWFLWNSSSLVWFGAESWWPATLNFEKQLISVISWIHGKTGRPFYLPLLLRELWRCSWDGFFIQLEYIVKTDW